MKQPLGGASLARLSNPVFREYAARYVRTYDDFLAQVRATGIELDVADHGPGVADRLARLRAAPSVQARNDGKSLVLNCLSPACVACQTGQGSATFFISLQCHRDCYFCFNPNQEDYAYHSTHVRDPLLELDALRASGQRLEHVALTGGEPLLHKAEAVAFFRRARAFRPCMPGCILAVTPLSRRSWLS